LAIPFERSNLHEVSRTMGECDEAQRHSRKLSSHHSRGVCASPHAVAGTPYDGAWSVLIVTDQGTCDRAYRYALRIADGRVYYDDPSFNVSGSVNARGQVHVGVDAGGQSANGYGRLSGNFGSGSWSGRSSTSQCSGHWEAERRG
jgi:hypothetical protein